MILAEAIGRKTYGERVKIYATDIDEDALNHARHRSFSGKDIQSVPADLREKYFECYNSYYNFDPELGRSIIFGRHDLFHDAPISRLDLLVCRNTLMYFNSDVQSQILLRFHFALNDPGYLFLGKAELLLKHAALFSPLELRHHIFSKIPDITFHDRLMAFSPPSNENRVIAAKDHNEIRYAAFYAAPVAQIVIDPKRTLLMFNEQARNLLDLKDKDLMTSLQDLEISVRPVELRPLIDQLYNEQHTIVRSGVLHHLPQGGDRVLDVQMNLLQNSVGDLLGVSVAYSDMTHYQELKDDLQRYTHELETAYEELQSSNEELETTNEELQSTVEELETTNEELQSSSEEMETMNEELQSTNEELENINEEMHTRTEELNTANSFLQSILGSLNSAVVVVDRNLSIQIWNRQAENMWGLRQDEVLKKSILTLDIGLPLEDLAFPFRAILEKKSKLEEITLESVNRRGRQFKCNVTCNPLFNKDDMQQGIVIVMENAES